eukprot:TRINITY_DN5224_c0_g1_i4.p2 TRINITY_DN5224_c0_g1~~TRINITY_DN5224_c0_g1_i4.p2  ORF type:complete len:112 (-),score=33.42 TRINITY_DN5224_c0_g1_i4:2-337(-)
MARRSGLALLLAAAWALFSVSTAFLPSPASTPRAAEPMAAATVASFMMAQPAMAESEMFGKQYANPATDDDSNSFWLIVGSAIGIVSLFKGAFDKGGVKSLSGAVFGEERK